MNVVSYSRKEDMSPDGQLRVMIDSDGDIHVAISGPENEEFAGVEFCNCGMGGGKNPRTMKALKALAEAIEADNAEYPSRKGTL